MEYARLAQPVGRGLLESLTSADNTTVALREDFAEALAAARAGASWAWHAIYRDLAPDVLGYLRARSVRDPDDVLSEVFLQVVRDLHRFTGGEAEFRAWVFTIASHRRIDAARADARRMRAEPATAEQLAAQGPIGDAERDALANGADREALEALCYLSDDQQRVLLLRIFGGFTVPEVSRILRKREGTVKSLQRRGLARLRAALEPAPGESNPRSQPLFIVR